MPPARARRAAWMRPVRSRLAASVALTGETSVMVGVYQIAEGKAGLGSMRSVFQCRENGRCDLQKGRKNAPRKAYEAGFTRLRAAHTGSRQLQAEGDEQPTHRPGRQGRQPALAA